MAQEILALLGDSERNYSLCFLYPVTAPVAGFAPTPTPTDSGDHINKALLALLTPGEKTALDAGTLAYEIMQLRKDVGLSNQALLARAREMYASRKAVFDQQYPIQTAHYGARFDAV